MFKLKKFSTPSAQLSFQETRDLSWCIANPDICFNVSKHMLIDGILDRDLLIRAVEAVALRHEALRTSFSVRGEQDFTRRIADRIQFEPEVLDRSSLPVTDDEVGSAVRESMERRFGPEAFPLFRMLLIRVRDGKTLLVITIAHVICDAASVDVFAHDLGQAYGDLLRGGEGRLPPSEFALSDYVQSHREWMASADYEDKIDRLRAKLLPGLQDVQRASAACGVAKQKARKAAVARRELTASSHSVIEKISSSNKVTPAVAVLAVAALALSKVLEKRRFFLSFMFSNRHHTGLSSLIGHIAHAVPMLIDLDGKAQADADSFVASINKDFLLSTSLYGIIPLGAINSAVVGLDPVLSLKSPFNRLMVNVAGPAREAEDFGGMAIAPFRSLYAGYISNDLQMHLTHTAEGLRFACRCPEELVEVLPGRAATALEAALQFAGRGDRQPLMSF